MEWAALCLVALIAAVGSAESEPPASQAEPEESGPIRRVLLVSVDSLRADSIGALKGAVATPALDRLIHEGTLVRDATTPTPSTGPAHASLLTGLHPWRHQAQGDAESIESDLPTLAEQAAENGIATAAFVSSSLLHPRFGFARGFDTYEIGPTEPLIWRGKRRENFWRRGAATADAAMAWLTQHHEQSFLLWVQWFDPHAPYLPPPEFAGSPEEPVDLSGKLVPQPLRDPDALAMAIRRYRGEVRYVDHQLDRLVGHLDSLGVLDTTTVVLTAAHGEGLGDHGWLEHDANLFDELVNVPLVVRGPGIPRGRALRGPAQLEDVMPTLLSALGVAPVSDLDGWNLMPWLAGRKSTSPRDKSLGQRRREPGSPDLFYVRDGTTKWIGSAESTGMRYEIAQEPGEVVGISNVAMPALLRDVLASLPASIEPAPDAATTAASTSGVAPSSPAASTSGVAPSSPATSPTPTRVPRPEQRATANPLDRDDASFGQSDAAGSRVAEPVADAEIRDVRPSVPRLDPMRSLPKDPAPAPRVRIAPLPRGDVPRQGLPDGDGSRETSESPLDARQGPLDAREGPLDAREGPLDAREGPLDAREDTPRARDSDEPALKEAVPAATDPRATPFAPTLP